MVRITNSLYREAYDYIKNDSLEGNCIIFVAPDVDSICAVRLFQSVLKTDIIQHKIVPVSGHQDLVDANTKLVEKDQDLRSIVMINCGAMESISNLFNAPEGTKIYIIDSHRPLLLENLSADNNHICVFDDDNENNRVNEVLNAYEELMQAEEDQEFSESDMEDSEDEEDRPRQRRKLNNLNQGMSLNALRSKRRQQNKLIQDYYEAGAYYANSVSGVMYELAHQLGKSNNELLWFGIVGVTAQYIFERMDTERYAEKLELFKDDRARLNIDRNEDGQMLNPTQVVIRAEDEYRFMLFRHWSLYESMYHSGYVSSKLGVWKDAGKKRLNNMFAKMGFSLQQCQQIYTHMDMDLKQTLRNKIEHVAPLYGLTDICFPSFTRGYGYECCMSASDVVYALSTLIETSPQAATRLGTTVIQSEDQAALQPSVTSELVDGLGFQRRNWWMHNFYAAYDALGSPTPEALMRGLKLCMASQKAIVRQGIDIIDKRMVKLLRTFRFVNIRNGSDLALFQHPSTLTKLGLFLMDAYREHGKRNLPIILTSLDEENNSCLVVALSGAATFGDVRKNTFSLAFSDAAEKTKARVSFDCFDHTVVQIHDADIEHFIESLSYHKQHY